MVTEAVVTLDAGDLVWQGRSIGPRALLPVVGKPLIGHLMDELRDLDLARIWIVTENSGGFHNTLRTALRPAMVSAAPLAFVETPDAVKPEGDRVLSVSGDAVHEPALAALMQSQGAVTLRCRGRRVCATLQGVDAFRANVAPGAYLDTTTSCQPVDAPEDFLRLNLDILTGRFRVTHVPGLEVAPGLRMMWTPGVAPRSVTGPGHFADGVEAHGSSRIENSIIGADVKIGPQVSLRNCVVLPHTEVPAGLERENAVLGPDFIAGPVANRTERQA